MTGAATDVEELRRRAARLGVETSYEDVDDRVHHAPTDVLATVVDTLEASDGDSRPLPPVHVGTGPIEVPAALADATLVVEGQDHDVTRTPVDGGTRVQLPDDLPIGCHRLEVELREGRGPCHGVAQCLVVQPPPAMVRTPRLAGAGALFVPTYALWERDRPLPSFTHLVDLAAALPALGIDALATLPVFATFLDEPCDPSPYSPVSRLHWNEVYIDDTGLPDAPLPRLGALVDWPALGRRRRGQLLDAARDADPSLLARIADRRARHPEDAGYARFQAQRAAAADGTGDPELVERSHLLAQLLADDQLGAVRADADRSDTAALVLDLPVGSHPEGYERWAHPDLFAPATSVGAPPDTFFRSGQDWGFPPQLPGEMRTSGYRLLRSIIERAARHADVLRIDHVMATHRLWWIPEGQPADRGVYVRYPREEMMAVIAATAAAAGITLVGEDLGTVPPEVADSLERWEMLGMYEEQFHLDERPLPTIPRDVVAGPRTHDMEPFAALAAHTDLAPYRARLAAGLGRDIADSPDATLDAMLERLAASDAYLVVADLDDLIGEVRPHNVPGRVLPELWSRRLDEPVSDTLRRDDLRRRLSILERSQP